MTLSPTGSSDAVLLIARTQLEMIGASNAVVNWTMDSQAVRDGALSRVLPKTTE
jgi:hypothetical protein